ncbi:MAG TPA: dihydrodipicolinate synthase family protein [Cyclobacteriaceae bacterium]|nr:dihydrodipicolinate synthase family protein [Cyclobacteriaceae bacterium]
MAQKSFSEKIRVAPDAFGAGAVLNDRKFVPVMVTPFKADSTIDFNNLSRLVDFYLASGVKGFFANCLSSEMYNLDDNERLALAAHVVKQVNGTMPVVATGSFGKNVKEQAEFAKKMYQTGVNAVILITSHFAEKNDSDHVLIDNIERFLSLTGTIPMGTYECPSPYKRIITPAVLQYLLSTNRIVYHKDTTLDLAKIKVKLEMCKDTRLEFYDAHAPNTMYSLQMGAKGMSAIAGNFYPEIFVWMCDNFNNPDKQEDVKWLQSEITRVDSIISQGYPLTSKYYLQKRGLPIELISRSNKGPLTAQQKNAIDKVHRDVLGWHERLGLEEK